MPTLEKVLTERPSITTTNPPKSHTSCQLVNPVPGSHVESCSVTSAKKCASHYKQLAFAIPFFTVSMMYAGADITPTSCTLALVAGTLAGATSYGLYRAIKVIRHRKNA